MIKVEKLEDKVKFVAFGKSSKHVAKRNAHKNDNKSGCDSIDKCGGIECDTCKTDDERYSAILRKQSELMEKEILNVKECTKGRVGQVFKMKENIIGSNKAGTEPHAIKDPENGELLVANEDIMKATLKYCVDNLKRPKHPEVEAIVAAKKAAVDERLMDKSNGPLILSDGDFGCVMNF